MKILSGFCEVLLCDARVCVGGVAHGLCLVLNTALVGALARQIVILLGCVPLILPQHGMKSRHWPSM